MTTVVSLYPGCAMSGTSVEYKESLYAVCRRLGMDLRELEDWNCCGASSAHMTAPAVALALPQRNLQIAYRHDRDLLVPCSACFARLKQAEKHILKHQPDSPLGRRAARTRIFHLNDLFVANGWLHRLQAEVRRPLRGLRAAPYYGCLSVRPREITDAPHPENPTAMDRLLEVLGAEVVEWSYKVDCCGGSLTMTRPDLVRTLTRQLLEGAREAGAECLVAACPLCQSNLDTRQGQIAPSEGGPYRLPVFFLTELMAVALEIEGLVRWWKKHFVDPVPLLTAHGLHGRRLARS